MIMNSKFLKINKNDEEPKNFLLKSKNSHNNSFKKSNSLKIQDHCVMRCFIWSYPTYAYPATEYPVIPFRPLRN